MNTIAELILTITIIKILPTGLLVLNFVNAPAYALNLLPVYFDHVNLEGPAPCVAPTPQERGPLLTLTLRRGRLPSCWASPHLGAGPKLLLPVPTVSQCKDFADELTIAIRMLAT